MKRGVKVTWDDYAKQCASKFIHCKTKVEYDALVTEIDEELKRDLPTSKKELFWKIVHDYYYSLPRSVNEESLVGTALGELTKAVQAMIEQRAGIKK